MPSLRISLVVLAFVTGLLAGCGGDDGQVPGAVVSDPVGHVHALGYDPADSSILVAGHNGLFRAAAGAARARPIGEERRDVMGFSVEVPGRYVGSGHPDLRQGGPTSVGYIRSSDGGRSWQSVSLEGRADLHAIVVSGRRVYAFDALSGKLLRSRDTGTTWASTSVPPIVDMAIDPAQPNRLVASTEMGLIVSSDGGRGFKPLVRLPPSHLEWDGEGILAVGEDRVAQRIDKDLRTINQVGTAPIVPAAMTLSDRGPLLAADDGAVYASSDQGRTWSRVLSAIR